GGSTQVTQVVAVAWESSLQCLSSEARAGGIGCRVRSLTLPAGRESSLNVFFLLQK
ncbi:hypothetical protein NDU88_006478, partial [Pleurodeles waltl]